MKLETIILTIKESREGWTNTRYMVKTLEDLQYSTKKFRGTQFWEREFDRDWDKHTHQSYELFQIWLSKLYFVCEAMDVNPFNSEAFVWLDMGHDRAAMYVNKHILHKDNALSYIPQNQVLISAIYRMKIPETTLLLPGYGFPEKYGVYVAGGTIAGRAKTLRKFRQLFDAHVQFYILRNLPILDDQAIILSTCYYHPEMCAMVTSDGMYNKQAGLDAGSSNYAWLLYFP